MSGLIDGESIALCERDSGLAWLFGGLGGPGLSPDPATEMVTEGGVVMVTESNDIMLTE